MANWSYIFTNKYLYSTQQETIRGYQIASYTDRIPFGRRIESDGVIELLQAGDRYCTIAAGVDRNPRSSADACAVVLRDG